MRAFQAAFATALMTVAAVAQQPPAPIAVGQPAPELGLEGLLQAPAGAKTTLDSLRGHVVVLEFWATWCAPCIAAFPHITELATEFKDQPVRFIAVTDEGEAKVKPCLAKHPITAWVGLDTDAALSKAFHIRSIPTTIVIGKDGVVAGILTPKELTSERLRAYVAGARDEAQPVPAPKPAQPEASAPKPAAAPPLVQITVRETDKRGGMARREGSMEFRGTAVRDALASLNNLPSEAWVVGPDELLTKRVAVQATVPPQSASRLSTLVGEALQTALGFEARLQDQETDVLVLTAPSGAGKDLRASQPAADGADYGHVSEDKGLLTADNVSLVSLVSQVEQLVKRPVVDSTGLKGRFDWDVRYTDGDNASMLAALRDQLGLVATPQRQTIHVLVVTPVQPAK